MKNGVYLLWDIAPGHAHQVVMAAANECICIFLRHPQDSINLTPCKYYLFSKLKKSFRSEDFGPESDVIRLFEGVFTNHRTTPELHHLKRGGLSVW